MPAVEAGVVQMDGEDALASRRLQCGKLLKVSDLQKFSFKPSEIASAGRRW